MQKSVINKVLLALLVIGVVWGLSASSRNPGAPRTNRISPFGRQAVPAPQGGPGGPTSLGIMIPQGGGNLAVADGYVYVLQGNVVFQLSAKNLQVVRARVLMPPQGRPGPMTPGTTPPMPPSGAPMPREAR
ncbi:MAG: hypothetical protein ACYC2Y_08750 [Armatimonadota bacterium]